MATLSELDDAGAVFRLDPGLPPRIQEERLIYIAPQMPVWIEQTLPTLGSTWNIELAPMEQLVALVEDFCSGRELAYERQFRPLRYKRDGIWELKTPDLRLFGWFPHVDCFLLVRADLTQRVKDHNLYHGYAGEVDRFRAALDLNEPKYMEGDDPHAVVSNYSYP